MNERNMLVAENFIPSSSYLQIWKAYSFRLIGGWLHDLLKPVAFLHLKNRLHSHLEKSIIEEIVQYFKHRTESLNDYYPSNKKQKCDLQHLYNWIKIFVYAYNTIFTTKRRLHYFLWKKVKYL